MKLIESKAEYIPQVNLYKHMELCGRIAYKSEDKITNDSARVFVNNMINAKHGAVLEHGTVYLIIPEENQKSTDYETLIYNPYTKCVLHNRDWYITTNYRVLLEKELLHMMIYELIPTEHHIKRYTMKFTTDRGISHELVRHRKFSFLQESTRYCNYTKDKFDNTITYIVPSWFIKANKHQQDAFIQTLKANEDCYIALLGKWDDRVPDKRFKTGFKENPLTPQEARQVLPNALKTEIVMTGFAEDWIHFFNLRWKGTTGKPHPDMVILAKKALEEFEKANVKEIIDII